MDKWYITSDKDEMGELCYIMSPADGHPNGVAVACYLTRQDAESIIATIKELAEVKEERDRLQLILKADSEHIVEIEAERDRYRDALEDCRPHEHRDDCRWPCTCGKDKADTALEAK